MIRADYTFDQAGCEPSQCHDNRKRARWISCDSQIPHTVNVPAGKQTPTGYSHRYFSLPHYASRPVSRATIPHIAVSDLAKLQQEFNVIMPPAGVRQRPQEVCRKCVPPYPARLTKDV